MHIDGVALFIDNNDDGVAKGKRNCIGDCQCVTLFVLDTSDILSKGVKINWLNRHFYYPYAIGQRYCQYRKATKGYNEVEGRKHTFIQNC